MFSGCGRNHVVLQCGFTTLTRRMPFFLVFETWKFDYVLIILHLKHQFRQGYVIFKWSTFICEKRATDKFDIWFKISPVDYREHVLYVRVSIFGIDHVQYCTSLLFHSLPVVYIYFLIYRIHFIWDFFMLYYFVINRRVKISIQCRMN